MNLTRTPTPRTNHAAKDGYTFDREDVRPAIEFSQDLEREASAWKAVAEMFSECLIIDDAQSIKTWEAFDALKSQLNH